MQMQTQMFVFVFVFGFETEYMLIAALALIICLIVSPCFSLNTKQNKQKRMKRCNLQGSMIQLSDKAKNICDLINSTCR